MNLPGVDKMVCFKYSEVPGHPGEVHAEIKRFRLSLGKHVVDLDIYLEDMPPIRKTVPVTHLKAFLLAREISRIHTRQRREREVTFEDEDGFAYKKVFKEYI